MSIQEQVGSPRPLVAAGAKLKAWRPYVRPAVVLSAFIVFLAAPLGLLWSSIGPGLNLSRVEDGAETELTRQFSVDAHYALIVTGAGILLGLAAGWVSRAKILDRYLPSVYAAVVFGGTIASLVMAKVGEHARYAGLHHVIRADLDQSTVDFINFRLRSEELIFLMPAIAVIFLSIWIRLDSGADKSVR